MPVAAAVVATGIALPEVAAPSSTAVADQALPVASWAFVVVAVVLVVPVASLVSVAAAALVLWAFAPSSTAVADQALPVAS